jgi:hypothetical protein
VSKNPDPDQVVAAWDGLPDLIKAQILELVKTVARSTIFQMTFMPPMFPAAHTGQWVWLS